MPLYRYITIYVFEILQNPGSMHNQIMNRIVYQYLNMDGVLGWELCDSENDDNVDNFLLFAEFVFN